MAWEAGKVSVPGRHSIEVECSFRKLVSKVGFMCICFLFISVA